MDRDIETLQKIRELKKQVENSLEDVPDGYLRCQMVKGKYPQYYHVCKENKNEYPQGRYMRQGDEKLVKQLAQKEYDLKVLDMLEKKEKALAFYLRNNVSDTVLTIYDSLPEAKRRLVIPYDITDEDYIREWYQNHKGSMNSFPFSQEYETERKELTRSKSEKMIADKLYYRGIPYSYETMLRFKNGRTIYPDFTILNIRTRKTYYYEHFGIMDDPSYCKKSLEKIEMYEENGIHTGVDLFYTMECGQKSVNLKQIENLISQYFI